MYSSHAQKQKENLTAIVNMMVFQGLGALGE
jgi:hypothetical protein